MTKFQIFIAACKGLFAVGVAGLALHGLGDVLDRQLNFRLPNYLFNLVVITSLYFALHLGAGKMLKKLAEEHQNRQRR